MEFLTFGGDSAHVSPRIRSRSQFGVSFDTVFLLNTFNMILYIDTYIGFIKFYILAIKMFCGIRILIIYESRLCGQRRPLGRNQH